MSVTNGPVSMQYAGLTEQYIEQERFTALQEEVRRERTLTVSVQSDNDMLRD